jgi:4-diphosphocytidyl-2-C-methyl-D-erythritol kinase
MTNLDHEAAPLKINLFLHITGRREDGYHFLQSLFAFADFGDRLEVAAHNSLSLAVTGPFAGLLQGEDDNLVLRAALALQRFVGKPGLGAALTLVKNVPVASGLGGGSADAAAALRLLNRYWRLNLPLNTLEAIALTLGADVPACVSSKPQWVEGIGDVRTPIPAQHAFPALIVNPGIALATPDVFAQYKKNGRFRAKMPQPAGADLLTLLAQTSNDLEHAACAREPGIAPLLEALQQCQGAFLSRMSGSGASCFALFKTRAAQELAAKALRVRFPAAWICRTSLVF